MVESTKQVEADGLYYPRPATLEAVDVTEQNLAVLIFQPSYNEFSISP